MMGYIIAAISISISQTSEYCGGLLCWRWPILIEIFLLTPLYVGFYFVPSEHIEIQMHTGKKQHSEENGRNSLSASDSSTLLNPKYSLSDTLETTPLIGQKSSNKSTPIVTPVKVSISFKSPLTFIIDSFSLRSRLRQKVRKNLRRSN